MSKITEFFLGKKKDLNARNTNLVDLFTPTFSGSSDPSLNATFMSVCTAHARHLSKIEPGVYLKDKEAASKSYMNRILALQPNPLMTAPKMYEMLAMEYYLTGTALLFIEWDYTNYKEPLKHIWPLDYDRNSLDVARGSDGKAYVKFTLDGIEHYSSMDHIILLSRNVRPGDLFGRGNAAVQTVLKVIQTNYEGIEQAIKTSAFLRFLVKSTTPLSDKVKEEKAAYFAKTYLGKDSSGVAYVDGASDIVKVDSAAKYSNAEEMANFKKEIYHFLGANEKILEATYNENEWQAYYESVLEPFILQLEAELSVKLFTPGEISAGNRVQIKQDRLSMASSRTRIQIANAYLKLPVIVPNVVSDLLFLPRTDNGDKEFSTLNYVQTDKQNEYQGVGAPKGSKTDTEDDTNDDNQEDENNAGTK